MYTTLDDHYDGVGSDGGGTGGGLLSKNITSLRSDNVSTFGLECDDKKQNKTPNVNEIQLNLMPDYFDDEPVWLKRNEPRMELN